MNFFITNAFASTSSEEPGNEGILFFLGILLCAYSFSVFIEKKKEKNKQQIAIENAMLENYMQQNSDFSGAQKLIGSDYKTGLAVNEKDKKIFLVKKGSQGVISFRVFSYKNLLSVEIFEDGETVTSTVRSSQIGGALIGGLVLGGAGAIIGGLSGKTKTSGEVEKIVLRLVVNHTKYPLHEIYFLNSENGNSKKTEFYQYAMQQARHWHSLIEVLIKRADMEDKENAANNVVQISQSSIADEIKKLAELRDAGILSDVEFQQQKEKLLG